MTPTSPNTLTPGHRPGKEVAPCAPLRRRPPLPDPRTGRLTRDPGSAGGRPGCSCCGWHSLSALWTQLEFGL